MNVAMFAAAPAEPSADPLDHLADVLFHKMGSPGVYARTALYEDVVERLAALITRYREPDTEVMRFPPVMNRGQLEKSGYLKSFPNLLGCVCGLHGTESEIDVAVGRFDAGGDWTTALSPADLVLSPAACYPVYPIAASRGPVPAGGWLLRRRRRLLPSRALAPSRPAAVLQDARIRLHRQPRPRLGVPGALDDARSGDRQRSRADLQDRLRQRSVLRPGRTDEGGEPESSRR